MVLSYQFVNFGSVKNNVYNLFLDKELADVGIRR